MSELLGKMELYWQFPFVRYALIVGVLIALCSSLLGVTLVLKRFSFIGDGLSHVAFGAMAVASVMGLADPQRGLPTGSMPVVLAVTVLCAVLLLRTGQNTTIKGDAAVAMLSVGALALGYLLMNVFSTSSNLSGDVCTTLFGSTSILTLTPRDVWLSVVLSLAVVVVFVLFYHKIFAVTFDEDFARATGVKAGAYNLMIAIVTAVVIVLAMNLVGSLLISALVIFPALSAMRVFKSFLSVTVCSVCLSVGCALLGMVVAILAGTPVGSTIVAADMAAFGVFYVAGKVLGGMK
ncbi:MAG: metal ABC transporter permease [Fretibacterium sp.]|nr:metal ABC transporter permease [Fretibacterium sp.]